MPFGLERELHFFEKILELVVMADATIVFISELLVQSL